MVPETNTDWRDPCRTELIVTARFCNLRYPNYDTYLPEDENPDMVRRSHPR